MKKWERIESILLVLALALCLGGCGIEKNSVRKLQDLKFEVVEKTEIPEELVVTIEEKQKEGFKLTYADENHLYIAMGFGIQPTGGYSISVDECYETKNAVYFATTLTGPAKGEKINQVPSYPYIVVKLDKTEKSVVFE